MTWFEAGVTDGTKISAPCEAVWAALTDPVLLPKLTPLLSHIVADGDIWRWQMARIDALGVSVVPCFTEQMTFTDGHRIEYHHAPPDGARERAGADGTYDLTEIDGGTQLAVAMSLRFDLPLPGSARRPVTRIMKATMDRTGAKFAQNLLRHLGAHEL